MNPLERLLRWLRGYRRVPLWLDWRYIDARIFPVSSGSPRAK